MLVGLQACLGGCSSPSQDTLRCWLNHPAEPPASSTLLLGCQAALSLPVRGTRAASPFSRDTLQWDEDGATPWCRECGAGLPQPVSFRMLLVTPLMSHSVCGCCSPVLAPWFLQVSGGGCGPLPSLSMVMILRNMKGDKRSPIGKETTAGGVTMLDGALSSLV